MNAGNVLLTAVATSGLESVVLPGVPVHVGVGTAFEGWQYDTFDSTQRANPDVSSLSANPDLDRLNNWGEWVFGTHPLLFGTVPIWIERSTDPSDGQTYYEVTFQRSVFATGVRFDVEESDGLTGWSSADASLMAWSTEPHGKVEWVTYRSRAPLTTGAVPKKFFRVIASTP